MTAALPVAHGTAEQLARIRHFRGLDLPEAHELDPVARFLVGRVTDPAEVLEQITDELDLLWSLVTEDFDDDQLDELTEDDWARHSFATQQQEVDFRHSLTIARLMYAIEAHIALHRVIHAERGRTVRTGAAAAREFLGMPVEKHYSVAPRLSALKAKKLVEPTAMVRDHFQAYVATAAARGEQPEHPFGPIFDGTVDTRQRARRIPEHLRTDDMPSYLRQKGELA